MSEYFAGHTVGCCVWADPGYLVFETVAGNRMRRMTMRGMTIRLTLSVFANTRHCSWYQLPFIREIGSVEVECSIVFAGHDSSGVYS